MKKEVFKQAWNYFRSNIYATFAQSLKQAWKVIKLKSNLLKGVFYFEFKKKDGSIREACGTLKYDMFDYDFKGFNSVFNGTLAYYDLDAKGWRSFKVENLI